MKRMSPKQRYTSSILNQVCNKFKIEEGALVTDKVSVKDIVNYVSSEEQYAFKKLAYAIHLAMTGEEYDQSDKTFEKVYNAAKKEYLKIQENR